MDGIRIPVEIYSAAVPCSGNSAFVDISTSDYLFKQLRAPDADATLFADEKYKKSCRNVMSLESSLGSLLEAGSISLSLDPVLDASGVFAGDDASLTIEGQGVL